MLLLAVATVLATPLAAVVAVAGEKVALAPVEGAVKLTATPATGLPFPSLTRAVSGVPNAAPTIVDCEDPPEIEGAPVTHAAVNGTSVDSAAICRERSAASATRFTALLPGTTKLYGNAVRGTAL